MTKRLSDPPLTGNLAKKPKLVEVQESLRIVGPQPSLLETVNGKVRKIPPDPFGEYCKEVRNESMFNYYGLFYMCICISKLILSIISSLSRSTHELYGTITKFE